MPKSRNRIKKRIVQHIDKKLEYYGIVPIYGTFLYKQVMKGNVILPKKLEAKRTKKGNITKKAVIELEAKANTLNKKYYNQINFIPHYNIRSEVRRITA